jgi:YHS domain-containing protein
MKTTFALLALSLFLSAEASAQPMLRSKEFNLSKNVAIQGYDPVAYFTQNKAVKGNSEIYTTADGVVYYFVNEGDKALFLKDWKKYEPQFGGWCAYAMGASGEKVEIDPETFKVSNGKLFLFYHSWTNNTLNKWNKDEVNLQAKADVNWAKFFH